MNIDSLPAKGKQPPGFKRVGNSQGMKGKRVVVTRSTNTAGDMAELLEARGAVPVFYPCIEIVPPEDLSDLDSALKLAARSGFDWLVFTSANAVASVAARVHALDIVLEDVRWAAIGKKTAQAVRIQMGVDVHFTASTYVAETLASEINVTMGQRILLPQADLARPVLARELVERGALVTAVEAYRTVIGKGGDDVPSMLARGQIDAITFTSASTVHNLLCRFANEGASKADLEGVCLAAIGPVTADALRGASLPVALVPTHYTVSALVEALDRYFQQET